MKKTRGLLGAALATFLLVGLAPALTPTEILEQSAALESGAPRIADYKMTVVTARHKERYYEFTIFEKRTPGGAGKAIRLAAPADRRGWTLLALSRKNAPDQFWLFDPGKKKTRKLDSSDVKDSFFESDLSYFDLGPRTPANCENQLLQQVYYEGAACSLIESRPPKDFDAPYAYWRSWVEVATLMTMKTEYYDKKNRLLKTIRVKKAEQLDGRWTATAIDAQAADQTDAKTTLVLTKATCNADVPDRRITTEGLGAD